MKIKNLVLALAILSFTNAAQAEPLGTVKVDAPKGWVADSNVGVAQGASVVFYPKGGSWDKSPVVFYLRNADKIDNSLIKTVDSEMAHYKENAPQANITDEPQTITKDGKIVIVKKIHDKKSDNMEVISFIGEPYSVSVITLNSKSTKGAMKVMPVYKQLVSSYSYAGSPDAAKKMAQKNAGEKESENTDRPTNNDTNITGTNLFTSTPTKNKHEQ
jgi:hypothetical protein